MTIESLRPRRDETDRGAYAVLYAVILLVMIGLVALVVDVGFARLDRRQNRSASDSAAVSGADKLGPSGLNPGQACTSAMNFAAASLNLAITTANNCSAKFGSVTPSGYCTVPASRPQIEATEVLGSGSNRRTVVFVWPVYDSSSFMTRPDRERRGAAVNQAIALQDGTACKRVGISIQQTRNSPFGAALRIGTLSTESRSVGLATFDSGGGDAPAPLVVLEPRSCDALLVTGNGSEGGGIVVAGSQVKPDGTRDPGMIQVDSAGSQTGAAQYGNNCNGTSGTIRQNGNKKRLWVLDGSPGIEGTIQSFAAIMNPTKTYLGDITGCPAAGSPWAATLSDTVPPQPNLCRKPTSGTPVGDAPWVNRYNCDEAVSACPPAAVGKPPLPSPRDYVNQWVRYATGTAPPLFANRILSASGGCTIGANTTIIGDFYTDCPELRLNANLSVSGKFVALHDVNVASGCLLLHHAAVANCDSAMAYVPPGSAGADGSNAYIGGSFTVDNGGAFVQDQVFMYVVGRQQVNTTRQVTLVSPYGTKLPVGIATPCSPSSSLTVAPSSTCFEDLAMWTAYTGDNNAPNKFTGNAALRVDGTLFMGKAAMVYNGSGDSVQERAQFVTRTLTLTGGGTLVMTPDSTRSTNIPRGNGTLIR